MACFAASLNTPAEGVVASTIFRSSRDLVFRQQPKEASQHLALVGGELRKVDLGAHRTLLG